MNKKELSVRAAEILRDNNIKKPVKIKRHTFTITDEDGTSTNFTAKRQDKLVSFSSDDVQAILTACFEAICESLQRGETVFIKEFGRIGLKLRPARVVLRPDSGEPVEIPAHYVPKVTFSQQLKMSVKMYEMAENEAAAIKKLNELMLQDMEDNDSFEDPDEDVFDEFLSEDIDPEDLGLEGDKIDFPDLEW